MTDKQNDRSKGGDISRRRFMATAAATTAAFTIVPRHVLGGPGQVPPSERVNFAGIGCGGMGGGDINVIAGLGANVVALCDVDDERAGGLYSKFSQARHYKDFRVMLEKEEKNIDAVTVGTPDNIHAPATMMALRLGKHVYCEKPLTKTIHEARLVAKTAKEQKVATQMGNQGHASEGSRLTNEWIQAGVIGEVREVHVWTDRAGTLWPQGITRPSDTPPVPATLDWDLWLGPAPERPYHPAYAPVSWRGWWDFGTGALGDMGCHIIDHPYWALQLGHPTSVQAYCTTAGTVLAGNQVNHETYPHASIIYYEFPARGALPPVRMIWYEGGLMPSKPRRMKNDEDLPGNGVLYVGSKGEMYHGSHGGMPQLVPHELMEEAKKVPQTLPRSVGHHQEWLNACKGGAPAVSNFEYAGAMTEVVLLGNLAMRAPSKRLEWDGANLKVTNAPELDQFVHREYRKGWSL